MTPAGFWRRSAAWTLDTVAILALVIAVAWPRLLAAWGATATAMQGLSGRTADAMFDAMMAGTPVPAMVPQLLHDPRLLESAAVLHSALWQLLAPLLLGYALLALPVHVGGELSPWRGSPGKHLLGLAVTDRQGAPLSWPRVLLRHAAGLLSWLTLNLGHAMAALPPDKRALHDRIADARVVQRGTPGAKPRPRSPN
ncbi:MAG: RDD family protein [Pseudomonadota bacterium]|nr:RDD family protein [Pseudomonadota bacterium]